MLNRIQRRSLDLISIAPDALTRSHWLLKLAVSDEAHPKIIERLKKLYEARLFLEFGSKAPAPKEWVHIKKMKRARKRATPIKGEAEWIQAYKDEFEFPNF